MTAPAVNKGHVYFGSEDCVPRDNSIIVKETSPGHVQVHLGFLQFNHTYSIGFDIPKAYFLGCDIQSILIAAEKTAPNIYCKIVSIKEKPDFYSIELEFHAQKERLVKEEIKLSVDKNADVVIELAARVLGPGKGTPLLKNGIKCIGVVRDELSEMSDWQP